MAERAGHKPKSNIAKEDFISVFLGLSCFCRPPIDDRRSVKVGRCLRQCYMYWAVYNGHVEAKAGDLQRDFWGGGCRSWLGLLDVFVGDAAIE